MNAEEKYKRLRASVIKMLGVEDNPGSLLALLNEMHKIGADQDEDGSVALQLLVELIELERSHV